MTALAVHISCSPVQADWRAAATDQQAWESQPAHERGGGILHDTADDHSHLAHSDILPDEKKESADAHWARANMSLNSYDTTVTGVTDKGSCHRAGASRPVFGRSL